MAFCTKCGRKLNPDGTCDCEKAQAAQAAQQAQAEQRAAGEAVQTAAAAGTAPTAAKMNGMNANVLVAAAAAVVGVIVLVVIIAVCSGGSYKTPLKKFTKLVNQQSTDIMKYEKIICSPMDYKMVSDLKGTLKDCELFEEKFESLQDEIEDFYSDCDGLKLRYEITKANKLDDGDLKDISKDFKDSYKSYKKVVKELEEADDGDYEDLAEELEISEKAAKKLVKQLISYYESFEDVKVSKGYEVTFRFYGELDGDEAKTDKIKNIKIIKVDGDWYIYDAYEMFNGAYFDDELSDINLYRLYRNLKISIAGLY